VPRGQLEAGRSLGLSRGETLRSIVFPQAFRAIIPPIGNDFIAILKDTSLLSVLGILELTRNARQFTASTFLFPEGLFTLSFIYLTLVIALSLLMRWVERHFTPFHERS
jgi:polar amino acid transport system permease protein